MKSALLKANIAASLSEEKAKRLEHEVRALRRQLSHTTAALERARGARVRRVPPGRRRAKLKGDFIRVCCGDLHGAKRDIAAVRAFLADVRELNPHQVILGGDMVDVGGFLAQNHVMGYVAETAYSYEEDIAVANDFLNQIQRIAGRAGFDYLEGNHERRVETWCVTDTMRHPKDAEMLRRAFAPQFLLKLSARGIPYYRLSETYDGLSIPGVIRRGCCYFFHGISTSKNAAAATLERTSVNSCFFHTHRAQADVQRRIGADVIGAYNPGCLCGLQPLWEHGRPTNWSNGYAVQMVTRTGRFLHLNVPIIAGQSLLTSLFKA